MKLAVVMYAANYTVRKAEWMHSVRKGFMPMAIAVIATGALLLLEPDFGAFTVIASIAMGTLFLGGINGRIFAALLVVSLGVRFTRSPAALGIKIPCRTLRGGNFKRVSENQQPCYYSGKFVIGFQSFPDSTSLKRNTQNLAHVLQVTARSFVQNNPPNTSTRSLTSEFKLPKSSCWAFGPRLALHNLKAVREPALLVSDCNKQSKRRLACELFR
jgi:hypothetical protein